MKSLTTYIIEGRKPAKHAVTVEWMKKMYKKFNKMYFNNELPSCKLEVKGVSEMGKTTWLGQFGFDVDWYFNRRERTANGYKMFTYDIYGKPVYATPKNIVSVFKPHIYMSTRYEYTWNQMEDTLLHEMVHWYTYMLGISPKQAHGPEFRAKCDQIRALAKLNGEDYELSIYASNDLDKYTLSSEEQQKAIEKLQKQKTNTKLLYYEYDPTKITGRCYKMTKRFGVYASKNVDMIVDEIKKYDNKSVTVIYELTDNAREKIFNKWGEFKTCRTYRFWDATVGTYAEVQNIVANDTNKKIIYKKED